MFYGTLTQTAVYPREVARRALYHNAAAVILAHNHPSGDTEPSRADLVLTRKLMEVLEVFDVRVLDHFIVAGATASSLLERGLLGVMELPVTRTPVKKRKTKKTAA
jgi:DNA repair protein RadC